jgi:S1-C subfamily serine protease
MGRDDAQNINFAIPIGFAGDLYHEVCETGGHRIRRASIGVRTATHRFDKRGATRWQQASGARLLGDPMSGSPASAVGLREGDVIVRLDDEAVPGSATLFRMLNRHRINKTMPLDFVRGGRLKHASITAQARPA